MDQGKHSFYGNEIKSNNTKTFPDCDFKELVELGKMFDSDFLTSMIISTILDSIKKGTYSS